MNKKKKEKRESKRKDRKSDKSIKSGKKKAKLVLNQQTENKDQCEDVTPEHCEELSFRKFTDDPKQIFYEVQALENRYEYSIAEMKTRNDKKVKKAQQKNGERYRLEIEKRKKYLDSLVHALEQEIQKNILALNSQEMFILAQIETIYQEKSQELVKEMISKIGFNF